MSRRGATVLELVIAVTVFSALLAACSAVLLPSLRAFASQADRQVLQRSAQDGLEKATRELRTANLLSTHTASTRTIQFRRLEGAVQRVYVIYYHNALDPTLNNSYPEPSYDLRLVQIAGLNQPVPYGSGILLARQVVPASSTVQQTGGTLANLDLRILSGTSNYQLIARVRRRN